MIALNDFENIAGIRDKSATIWTLTGPTWAKFLQKALRGADDSILLSLYLLSPHWSRRRTGTTNILDELCVAGQRLSQQGKTCRAVLGRPTQNAHTATYNLEAAARLTDAKWTVRLMRSSVTLHEKVMIIDDVVSMVGSHNISRSSAFDNLDTSIGIYSKTIATELKQTWWSRWNQAEPYRGARHENGKGNEPRDTNRPAGSIPEPAKRSRIRIL